MVTVKEKLIKDIEVIFDWEVNEKFYGVDSLDYFQIYSEVFLNLLIRKGFKCKGYDLIHVVLSEEYKDDISKSNTSVHKNGSAELSFDSYKNASDSEKDQLALSSIYKGLLDLVERDFGDTELITETYAEIQEKGIATELILKETLNKKYNLKVTYSQINLDLFTIYFTLTDKKSKESFKREMNTGNKDFVTMWLNSIKLSSKAIQMRPGVSTYGETTEQFDIHIGNFIKGSNFKNNYKENIYK